MLYQFETYRVTHLNAIQEEQLDDFLRLQDDETITEPIQEQGRELQDLYDQEKFHFNES
jgi:hypothetical protein